MTGPTRSVAVVVDAPPEVVWRLVTDVTRMGDWSPENVGAEWVSGIPGSVGSVFRGRNQRGRASWSTTCEVVTADPPREFVFAVGKPARPDTLWRYELMPLPDDRTEVRESFTLRKPLGLASRLLTRLTTGVTARESDLEDGMSRTLAALAAAAAGEAAAHHH